jgi:proline dehydrogenase
MFRSFFIYLSKASWAHNIVTRWSIGWRMASRFVAGERVEDAIRVIRGLNAKGINATLDHLGEHTTTKEEAIRATADIIAALNAIQQSSVRANISVKLTQIGLNIDKQLCAENLKKILIEARELNNFIRIDMEDSALTQDTLDLVYAMRAKKFTNVGIVIQAYLFRSEKDIHELIVKEIPVRLCKGAYNEPPEIAFPKKRDVDANFDRLARLLLDGAAKLNYPPLSEDGRMPPLPALATHDERRITYVRDYSQFIHLPDRALEFQMLHGIRRDLQERLAAKNFPVRVYVPYGTQWYPYFMRRLAERPANIWFLLSNYFRN